MTPGLDAIKARAEAATPGPWSLHDHALLAWHDPDLAKPQRERYTVIAHWGIGDTDAAFIAAARTDIPALVAHVEELRAILRPLLDEGAHASDGPFRGHDCLFCDEGNGDYGAREDVIHKPDCPVLRRAELLGES